jgi:hypothetical protein
MPRRSRKVKQSKSSGELSSNHDHLDEMIVAMTRFLGLQIDDVWKPTIRANFQVTMRHAILVSEFKLPDEAEPAPIFKP